MSTISNQESKKGPKFSIIYLIIPVRLMLLRIYNKVGT